MKADRWIRRRIAWALPVLRACATSGTKVGFSSLGPEVALASPGGNCVNATGACLFSIDTTINNGTTTPGTNGYTDQMNPNLGTSFSAPIVAGIAGLMISVNANLKPAQVIARLKEGAKTFPVSSDATVPCLSCSGERDGSADGGM